MTNVLPTDAKERKTYPLYSGFVKYFPHAIAAVAHKSYEGNQQHHPDEPLHWDMDKSTDEADALMRHLVDGEFVEVAWRAMALLERHLTGRLEDYAPSQIVTNTDTKPTIYVAGPMRSFGLEGLYNFPAFDAAASQLRDKGWDVVNPAELDRQSGYDPADGKDYTQEWLEQRMTEDLEYVSKVDALFVLDGWQHSVGTLTEIEKFYEVNDEGSVFFVWYQQNHDVPDTKTYFNRKRALNAK